MPRNIIFIFGRNQGGEFPFLILAAAFAVGGFSNVMFNAENIHNFWQGLAYFGVGAASAAAGVGMSMISIGIGGAIGGAIMGATGGAVTGFILGGGNALISGQNFWESAFDATWKCAAIGGVMGGIAGGVKAIHDGNNFWTGNRSVLSLPSEITAEQSSPTTSYASNTIVENENTNSNTLIHYTNEKGYHQILDTESLNPSFGLKNARYGEGQYLTNLEAKDYTAGQLSRRLYGVPWNTSKVEYYIKIDVNGLNVIKNNSYNFLIPGNNSLNLHGRIVDSGISIFRIKF